MAQSALRRFTCLAILLVVTACESSPIAPDTTRLVVTSSTGFDPEDVGVIFVISQGLFYDARIQVDPLSREGEFQLLSNGRTEFGPGQVGYVGGRFWEDLNNNGIQDEGDHFFLSPLIPPGRFVP
jgi:hypothetical protein